VDIILALDLPGFHPEALNRAPGTEPAWHDVLAVDDLVAGQTRRVECNGRGLFVHRAASFEEAADEWRVFDSRCPHETTNIPHLALQGHTLTCPKHEWVFDVRSGACIEKGTGPLKRWPSKVADGRLLAQW
jgi:nitrite reductase/ring-hydroxylating ferredoxin subunit